MAYSIQSPERSTSTLREEYEYQSSAFQRHKYFHGRKGIIIYDTQTPASADWANLVTHGSANASVSNYKKVNVKTRHQIPLVGTRRMCIDNRPRQSNVKSAALFTPVTSDLQENKPLTYNTPSDQLNNVFYSRGSRMYLNPHFFKANSSLPTNETAKRIMSESALASTSKHSVHINPKVLAEQVMKLTTQSQPTQVSVVASGCGSSKRQGARLQSGELLLEPSNANSVRTRYAFHSKTKLVKHNSVIHQTSTGNVLRNSGIGSQSVPKRNLGSLLKSPLPGPLMSVSRTKMVRAKPTAFRPCLQGLASDGSSGSVPCNSSTPSTASRRWSVSSSSRIRRNSFKFSTIAVKAAKAVCSKYKLNRSGTSKSPTKSLSNYATNKFVLNQVSRYKIDRRLHKTPKRLKNVKKYSLQYQTPKQGNRKLFSKHKYVQNSSKGLKFGNKMWNKSLYPRKASITENKLWRIGNSPSVRKSRHQENIGQSSSLVRIGGVLYRTSKMKLTRSLTPKCKNEVAKQPATGNVRKFKPRSTVAVYVRGNKFLMDETGKTLLRVPQSTTTSAVRGSTTRNIPLKRIDIGGVTFVQKSTNVLVRTNTHNARSRLSQAKHKSIALLTKKMKKSNQPCTFYHHFGKCVRKEMGTCPHVHDPKNVAVCWKFLQGWCKVTDCSLSHDVRPEKMPTCKYFLEGCCVRDNCPYLHVKVSAKAGICKDFLRGYCPDGQKCRKQHSYLCPEFEKAGSCPKGKYCAYPHKSVVENRAQTKKQKTTADKARAATIGERKRYYEMGEIVSLVHGAERGDPQVACRAESSDLNEKTHNLLKQAGDIKRELENPKCHADGQVVDGPDLMHETENLKAKRPKLGILPAYIPLGSSP